MTPEGIEVIRDVHRGTLEVYDLREDPLEADNLVGEEREDVSRALGTLDRYFEVHQFRRPGYREPFR